MIGAELINGDPPPLAGVVCAALICTAWWRDGALEDPAQQISLRINNAWHRLYFDQGFVFWRPLAGPPEPNVSPDGDWSYPLHDLGTEHGLAGQRIEGLDVVELEDVTIVTLRFADGRRLVLTSSHAVDRTDVEVVGR